MIFIRHEDLDDYLDSIGSEVTGNFVATTDGIFIDDVPPGQ